MRKVNGHSYKLVLLDTNVVSEILKNPKTTGKDFLQFSLTDSIVPCISIWTILEIRRKQALYEVFLEFFSVFPFFLTRTPLHVLEDEMKEYPNYHQVEPIQFSFSLLRKDKNAQLQNFMRNLFDNDDVKNSEQLWNSEWRNQALQSILALKPNFKPKGKYYTATDATRFIQEGVTQYVIAHNPAWAKKIIDQSKWIDVNAFPSVKMAFYTVFYRFYAENREPELQDIFDLLITNVAPYMDIVITENFQAEIFKKTKRRDPFLKNLEIQTLKSLRQKNT